MHLLGTKRYHTTAYHPISNGMVKHFHRQLKAALKCHQTLADWASSLSLTLLGNRTALKEDIHCSAAEMVYGTSLRLPGELFDQSQGEPSLDPTQYIVTLRDVMQHLCATPTRLPKQRKTHIDNALLACTHVFVQHNAV